MKLVETVGNTPMIELEAGASRPGIRLLAKLEGNNPAGSVKDRPARSMILRAEQRRTLRPGMRLIEPTSGNTGIALAMIAAVRGYAIELVMPENATAERVDAMRAFGAEVAIVGCQPTEGSSIPGIRHGRVHHLRSRRPPSVVAALQVGGEGWLRRSGRRLVFVARETGLDDHKLQRAVGLAVEKYCSARANLGPDVAVGWEARIEPTP